METEVYLPGEVVEGFGEVKVAPHLFGSGRVEDCLPYALDRGLRKMSFTQIKDLYDHLRFGAAIK